MKRIFLLLFVFLSLAACAQTIPSYKNVKLTQLPLGTKNDSIVLTNGSTKLLKYIPVSQIKVPTNLDYTATPTGGTVFSSTGNDAVIPLATTTNAGLFSPTDKTTIDGVQSALALKANVADSELISNKQNDLTTDGTGTKYPTVDAVNTKVSNIDNTSDANKPVSTATQTALNLKTLGYYNVKEYGAIGDNITDDTVAIQATINAAYDNNGGTVYFPNGIYKIGGALQSPNTGFANVNSQLTIKNTSDGFLTIKLLGETPPAQVAGVLGSYPVNTSGVVINSTITGSNTYPSILGSTGLVGSGYVNAIGLDIENIEFRVKANVATGGPNVSAVNASNILNVNLLNSFVGLDTSTNLSVYPTAETFGFYMPRTNLGQSSINNVAVTGLKVGYVFSEHVMGDLITAVGCEYAFYFADSYHPSSFNRLNSAWCKFPIGCGTLSFPNIGSNQSSVHIQQLDIEWQGTSYGNWFDSSYVINDPASHLKGYIEYQMVERSIGINNAGFNVNGAAKIQAVPLGLNHLPLNGGVLEKYNATVSNLLNIYNPNGNNGVGTSILLGTSLVEGNGNARITGTAFSGYDYRSQLRLQTTKPDGTWNDGIFIDENGTPTAPTAAPGTSTEQIATTAFVQGIRLYKVYTALLSQSGTSAPTATVLENTLGGTVVYSYSSEGQYKATLTGAFTPSKTYVSLTPDGTTASFIGARRSNNNDISIITRLSTGIPSDLLLDVVFIEIRVYN